MTNHLSASQLSMYLRCPESWRRRYVCGDIIRPNAARAVGTAVHHGAARRLTATLAGLDVSRSDVVDLSVEKYDHEIRDGADGDVDGGRDRTARLTGTWWEQIRPEIESKSIVAVEEKLEFEWPKTNIKVVSVVDVRRAGEVRELKTAARTSSWNIARANTELQATVYTAATGLQNVVYDVVADKGTATYSTTRTAEDITIVGQIAEKLLADAVAGSWHPAAPGSWWCSRSWCGYWATCPYISERLRNIRCN